jgi:predicted RNA binding protein YcfA (HicA-like mRNA interferase family)
MKLPIIKPKQLIGVLKKLGCVEKRQTGSHRIFYCSIKRRIISVPFHNKDLKKGLLSAIIKDLDLSLEEFNELLKH